MRFRVRDGRHPSAQWLAAVDKGVQAMGGPSVEVVAAEDFDGAVRELTGSTTYSADRGTGTVAAKTLATAAGAVIVVNTKVMTDKVLPLIERTLAHETGHVLIDGRGEGVVGCHDLVDSEWEWQLFCLAGFAMQEVRCEQAVGELGYPAAGSSDIEHVIEVLHATTHELVVAIHDPASEAPIVLMQAVFKLLDRLTKVLAYAATACLRAGAAPAVAAQGRRSIAAWEDFVAPTWERRLALYAALPPANIAMAENEWHKSVLAGTLLERDLLRSIGFDFENSPDGGYGFYRRADDRRVDRWIRRAIAEQTQADGYE